VLSDKVELDSDRRAADRKGDAVKKSLIVIAGALLLARSPAVQTTTPVPRAMPELMPGGPLIYLEAKDSIRC